MAPPSALCRHVYTDPVDAEAPAIAEGHSAHLGMNAEIEARATRSTCKTGAIALTNGFSIQYSRRKPAPPPRTKPVPNVTPPHVSPAFVNDEVDITSAARASDAAKPWKGSLVNAFVKRPLGPESTKSATPQE